MPKQAKNISGQTLSVIGVGVVKADEVVEVPDDFNNPNFEIVSNGSKPDTKTEAQEEHQEGRKKVAKKNETDSN